MEKIPNNQNSLVRGSEFFIDQQQNIEIADFFEYFEQLGAKICEPLPVKRDNETTLFVSSGVQLLDDCIHRETELPEGKLFVAQPVIRTQFIGSTEPESHTSFYNLSLLETQCSFEQHLENLESFLTLLKEKGFSREAMNFEEKEDMPKWGERKFRNHVIKVYYNRLEIGDAVYIPNMPQDSRPDFSISDIGFGLERINHEPGTYFPVEDDLLRSLALLELSGVGPGNKSHGYRYRLFSKKFVQAFDLDYQAMRKKLATIQDSFVYWGEDNEEVWQEDGGLTRITQECERNFNREIANYLTSEFKINNEIPINQTVEEYLTQIKQIDVLSEEDYNELKERLNYG